MLLGFDVCNNDLKELLLFYFIDKVDWGLESFINLFKDV